MVWSGRTRISRPLGRSAGTVVRAGDFLLPEVATLTIEGDKGEPDLEVRFEVREGRPECVEITARAKDQGRGLRTSDLQVLMVDALKTKVFATLSTRATYDPVTNVTTAEPIRDEREFWQAINAVDDVVKAPRRGITKAELEQVARVYRENVNGQPVQSVRAALNYNSERTAARRVEQAREAGLLPTTTAGKRRA